MRFEVGKTYRFKNLEYKLCFTDAHKTNWNIVNLNQNSKEDLMSFKILSIGWGGNIRDENVTINGRESRYNDIFEAGDCVLVQADSQYFVDFETEIEEKSNDPEILKKFVDLISDIELNGVELTNSQREKSLSIIKLLVNK